MNTTFVFLFQCWLASLCILPTAWEENDDQDGDYNKSLDVLKRVSITLAVSIFNTVTTYWLIDPALEWYYIFKPIALCFGVFFLIFDYWVSSNFVEAKKVFGYLGDKDNKGKLDNNKLWISLGPWGRFSFKITVFFATLIYYIQ